MYNTLWSLIDAPPRLLIFGKFSTQDILIPTPPLINSGNEFQERQKLHNKILCTQLRLRLSSEICDVIAINFWDFSNPPYYSNPPSY